MTKGDWPETKEEFIAALEACSPEAEQSIRKNLAVFVGQTITPELIDRIVAMLVPPIDILRDGYKDN